MGKLQLFITGVYRTGSTYLSLLINNHPGISVGLHTTNWFRESHANYKDAVQYAIKRWKMEPIQNISEEVKFENEWDKAMYVLLNNRLWGEKQQLETSNIKKFIESFSEGQAISIIRDPRSVLASWREYTFHDEPAHLQAPFNSLGAMQHTSRLVDEMPNKVKYIKYEDLASKPSLVLRKIIDWLGLQWPGKNVMLDQSNWSSVPGSQWEDRSSYDDPDDIDVESAINRWRGNLSIQELMFVEKVCGKKMDEFEYSREVSNKISIQEMKKLIETGSSSEQVERTLEMLRIWADTGLGVEMFPDEDVTNEDTWTENQ